jgi:flagellar protein FliS
MSTYATASRAYTESSVLTAPPERLVVMLYDGAGRFLARAAAQIRAGNAGAAGEPLGRASAILDELLATLDHDAGPIADRLESIYLFCERSLVEAQLRRDAGKVDRVAALLAELRDAWAQIAANPPATAPATTGSAVA